MTGPNLASHEADSVEAVAEFHRHHHAKSSRVQRAIDRTTKALAQPMMALLLIAGLLAWGAIGLRDGARTDQPVFGWLELSATLLALLIALLILVSQSRADELAERRAQLTLELALLADRRSAKIIALLEELRRDAPGLADRVDAESEAMAKPVDPHAVTTAIEETSLTGGEHTPS